MFEILYNFSDNYLAAISESNLEESFSKIEGLLAGLSEENPGPIGNIKSPGQKNLIPHLIVQYSYTECPKSSFTKLEGCNSEVALGISS